MEPGLQAPISRSGGLARTPQGGIARPEFPWWLAIAVAAALLVAALIAASELYAQVFTVVAKGIGVTVFVTLAAYGLASAIGLVVALMALSGSTILRQAARLYVEIIRGVRSVERNQDRRRAKTEPAPLRRAN